MIEHCTTSFPDLSIRSLLVAAVQRLQACDSARLDAELLLCKVLQIDRSQIYSRSNFEIPVDKIRKFSSLLEARLAGCPIAYLTGHREFWSLDLCVSRHTLIPRPETECLIESVLTMVPDNVDYSIADLGTGSGAIALALASERPDCRITAIDTCDNALAIARLNAECHGLNHIRFLKSNWFSEIHHAFDIIVSNPPYIRSGDEHLHSGDVAHEPVLALDGGEDGLNAIRIIITQSVNYLNPDGWLFIEHGYDQGNTVRKLFKQQAYSSIKTLPDYAGLERVTFGKPGNK